MDTTTAEAAASTGQRPARWPTFGRLRFPADLESSFAGYFFEQSLPYVRFAVVLTILLYSLFGILDLYIVPDVAMWIWTIRYAIVCPIAVAVLALSFTPWFERTMQPTLFVLALVCGLGIVTMVAIEDASAGYLYYAGLLLVVPWAYTLLRLRFAFATAAVVIVIGGYEVVAIWIRPMPLEIFLNNNFFLLSTVVIGMASGYTIERGIRTDFIQRRLIETQRSRLAEHNVHLDSALQASLEEVRHQAAELRASRGRVVAAGDAERRRIERNIHDGAQQQLVALGVRLRLASSVAEGNGGGVGPMLDDLQTQLQEALDELRTLAHGIYPPLLMDQGLIAALSSAARRSALPTAVDAASLGRYPTEVEATAYFCCLEAVQNACKYAGDDARVTIHLREDATGLVFEVVDDGVGFDPGTGGFGAGFLNMNDRLGAIGGSLTVDSAPGRGTRVSATIPLGGDAATFEGDGGLVERASST